MLCKTKGDHEMKVKTFGSPAAAYEETATRWFAENQGLEIKHVAITLNQAGDWVLTAIFYSD